MTTRPRTKYGAQPTVVDGIRFASKKEATRYCELKLLEKAGEIEALELQPRFALKALLTTGTLRGALKASSGEHPTIGHYVADFKYYDLRDGKWVIEDSKGFRTPMYRWKRRHTQLQYGIEIQEV